MTGEALPFFGASSSRGTCTREGSPRLRLTSSVTSGAAPVSFLAASSLAQAGAILASNTLLRSSATRSASGSLDSLSFRTSAAAAARVFAWPLIDFGPLIRTNQRVSPLSVLPLCKAGSNPIASTSRARTIASSIVSTGGFPDGWY